MLSSSKLLGETVSFVRGDSDPFILKNISRIKELWELDVDAIIVNEENPIYGAEGILVQPYAEAYENPEKLMTVLVYIDTNIEILNKEESKESVWSSYGHYY